LNLYVADTHTLYWYLTGSPKLSATAKAVFDEGVQGQALIYLPAIVLAELHYLNNKHGAPLDFAANLVRLQANAQYVFVPFTAADTFDFDALAATPEMHDQMIVGAALRLGATCLTLDSQIVNSGLGKTIW
jgi:PIN domain nuclease of toxin-antitoxin system